MPGCVSVIVSVPSHSITPSPLPPPSTVFVKARKYLQPQGLLVSNCSNDVSRLSRCAMYAETQVSCVENGHSSHGTKALPFPAGETKKSGGGGGGGGGRERETDIDRGVRPRVGKIDRL